MKVYKMKPLPYIIQGKNIVVILDNMPYTITESNIGYVAIKKAIKDGDWKLIPDLVTPKKAIAKFVKGHFELVDGVLYDEGVIVNNAISDRMFKMYEEGFSVDPLMKFYANIKGNPSVASANELYGFLEKNSLPITEDGCFIAYKRVRADYTDVYSGTMNNSVGKTVSMKRSSVNDNRNETCSSGLHFCSYEYLKNFPGARLVSVKINPKDVVSIPTDYNNSKGRCCKYEVVGEILAEDSNRDSLSETSVYVVAVVVPLVEKISPPAQIIAATNEIGVVQALGLRQQAKIWNALTSGKLKKFSYREDVDRRMYGGKFPDKDIVKAAKKLKLI